MRWRTEGKKQPTQVDAGTLSIAPEPTAVAALVEGARTAFLSGGGRHSVTIYLPSDLPRVMNDRERIAQALRAQTIQHDADLLLRGILLADHPADVLDKPLRRRFSRSGFLSCLMKNRLPCDRGVTVRHPRYAGQWRGTDRFCLGHHGP